MMHLKQSTASQAVLIGPFIDETDGISALTGLTIANTDVRLSANGGNIAAKNSGGGTHDELGFYQITLDATDTATVGRLQLIVHATGALPVYHEYEVLEEAIYDGIYAASAGALATQASVDTIDDLLDTELPALTTAVADLPTNAELATALGTADDAVLAAIAALNNLSAAQVNAEVLDVLNTDTFAEPTGVPGATVTLANKIGRLYQAMRNQVTVTGTKKIFYDDAVAALWEKDLSDNGTTYTETEGNAP